MYSFPMNDVAENFRQPVLFSLLEQGFKDAVVVVIGGRGGIGSEVVKLCSELGAEVIIGSRSAEQETELPLAASFSLDIGDAESIRCFTQQVAEQFGRVDILVNTAGSSAQLPLHAVELLEDELVDQVLRDNARAPLLLMREMTPLLRKGQQPVIVNLSSIAALTGGGSNIAYAAAKAALDTASKAFAKALAPEVRVVNISPSALDTDFAKGRSEDFIERTIAASALKRLATTREVAVAVLCAARLLTATTGVTIVCDAGRQL
jgi:3-oxoacyl-[acyl-carrier protein] reductase